MTINTYLGLGCLWPYKQENVVKRQYGWICSKGVSRFTDLIKLLQSSGNNVFLKMIVEVHDFHIVVSSFHFTWDI